MKDGELRPFVEDHPGEGISLFVLRQPGCNPRMPALLVAAVPTEIAEMLAEAVADYNSKQSVSDIDFLINLEKSKE